MKQMKDTQPEKRKEFGQKLNELKNKVTELIENKRNEINTKTDATTESDITLPGKKYPQGSLHIVTHAIEEISKIFEKIGFIRMSYPEIEWEFFSFETSPRSM